MITMAKGDADYELLCELDPHYHEHRDNDEDEDKEDVKPTEPDGGAQTVVAALHACGIESRLRLPFIPVGLDYMQREGGKKHISAKMKCACDPYFTLSFPLAFTMTATVTH
jgi:hypothetical protein